MSAVALVTDSSTCLPPAQLASLPVRVLPIMVQLPDREVADDGGPLAEAIYAALQQERPVTSYAPSTADYLNAAYQAQAAGAQSVIMVTPATEFTSMHRSALAAAELASVPVEVFDSRSAAGGLALVVLAGAEAARSGASTVEVLRVLERASSQVDLVATLPSLGPLRSTGKISPRFNSQPPFERMVFRMSQGSVLPVSTEEDATDALEVVAEEWRNAAARSALRTIVFHAAASSSARELVSRIGPVHFVSGFSAAMAMHTGPGVTGAAWLPF